MPEADFRHLKHRNLCNKGVFPSLFSSNFDDHAMESKFSQVCNFMHYVDGGNTPSENTGL